MTIKIIQNELNNANGKEINLLCSKKGAKIINNMLWTLEHDKVIKILHLRVDNGGAYRLE